MVSRKINQRQAVKKEKAAANKRPTLAPARRRGMKERFGKWWLAFIFGLVMLVAFFTLAGIYRGEKSGDLETSDDAVMTDENDNVDVDANVDTDADADAGKEVAEVDLQDVVDEWVESVSGNRSVIIYDLDLEKRVGEYNTLEDYNTASLYKLFVVYEGYRRVESGEWNGTAKAGATGETILGCLDLAIRESNSPCAETLWGMLGHSELDEIIEEDFEITGSNISNLLSNAEDILKIMKIFYEHEEITDEELVAVMKDSFLNQPVTTYNWRQGLPSGFSEEVNVYNKVGWAHSANMARWDIYHDAAIIEFPELDRRFIVVVMTNYVDNSDIARLGTMIEEAVREQME